MIIKVTSNQQTAVTILPAQCNTNQHRSSLGTGPHPSLFPVDRVTHTLFQTCTALRVQPVALAFAPLAQALACSLA